MKAPKLPMLIPGELYEVSDEDIVVLYDAARPPVNGLLCGRLFKDALPVGELVMVIGIEEVPGYSDHNLLILVTLLYRGKLGTAWLNNIRWSLEPCQQVPR